MTSSLRVCLLGAFRLLLDGAPAGVVLTPRLQALLAYLVLRRAAPDSRYHVAFLFWPESTEAQARANLRKLLFDLRHAIPDIDQFLASDAQALQWREDAAATFDVEDFQEAVTRADQAQKAGDSDALRAALEEAAALYAGDLLPGSYDDWILPDRERLSQLFVEVLERLIQLLESVRDYRAAIRYAQRLLRHDPLHEATYRQLMRLHALNGDRAGALRVYHTCVTILQRELAVGPSPATQEAYERLLQADAAPPPPPLLSAGQVPLIGRDREWARLQAVWQAAAAGELRFLLLSGEAGSGTTRLAEELVVWAARQGIAVASARCYEAELDLSFAPLTAWLRARPLPPLADVWLTELARVLPELLAQRPDLTPPGPLSESWQRQRLVEALARAFVKGNQPLVLLIDDLHWCDRDTLEWLHYLLHFDPTARILVLGTVRSDALVTDNRLAPLLEALRRTGQLTEIEVGPLSQAESFALAVHLAGRDIDPALAGPLYQGSEGNPLFVVEMVRVGMAKEGPWSAEHGQRMAHASLPLPPKVRMVIEARLAQLSPPARELAEVAATIGREFTFPVLLQASGGDEDAVVRRLDELWRRRIVREQGQDAYDFGHVKIREVAYSALSSARRRLLHRRVAEALESTHAHDLDAVSGQIATHYEQAGQPKQAVEWYGRAADAAQRLLAHEAAADYFRRALALLESEPLAGSPEQWRQEASARLSKGLADALAQSAEHEKPNKAHKTSSSVGKDEA